jgi:Mrp family chromosome partitioning ATPase
MLKLLKKHKEKNTLLTEFSAKSGYAESFRTMRTNLQFTSMEKNLKSICVTSATEMEGKTNTAANLAYTLAQTGLRVLMVDCDLRKPGLTKRFGLKKTPGLTELISRNLGTAILEGSISDIRLNDLIKLNKLQKRTGVLSISNDINQVDISFFNGNLTDIFWKNRPDEKKLASTLINHHLLTREQARIAIGHQKKSVQKLGAILTTMGMISKAELKKHLSVHIVEAFKTAVSMYDGRFSFSSLPGSQIDTTIDHNVNFDKLFREFLDEDNQFPFLTKAVESMIVKTGTENLYLLPSGNIPPNPSEMIGSDRMVFILEHVASAFDFVIIDTPPVLPASDAMMIAPNTDGILMVVKSNKVSKKYIKDAISQLETGSTRILGLILNQVDVKKERYYRYYRKYYTSYYGKTAEK